MAKKSSDSVAPSQPTVDPGLRGKTPVHVVTSDPTLFDRLSAECAEMPAVQGRYPNIGRLAEDLERAGHPGLAFVLLIEQSCDAIDALALRQLRLDYPQLVLMVICESCDQQNSLRLQSMGVHSILLPPFDRINMVTEISSAGPSTTQYKRNPDLMRRAQARLDMLIPSDLGYVLGINHEISLLLKEFGFPPQDTRINVPLACDEAITNAIVHGNDSQVEKKVAIQIYVSHSRFRIRVRDNGSGFDVATVADPTKGDNVMRSSGRGVYLMRKIMDSVEYKEDGRVLELEKRNSNAPD